MKLKTYLLIGLSLGVLLFFSACAQPGPLYGTWADNRGNNLSFFDDNTFSAKIIVTIGGIPQYYSGNYTLLLNSLTLDCTNLSLRIVTEWDIRGNILYIGWTTAEGDTLFLTLFKISN